MEIHLVTITLLASIWHTTEEEKKERDHSSSGENQKTGKDLTWAAVRARGRWRFSRGMTRSIEELSLASEARYEFSSDDSNPTVAAILSLL